MEEQALAVFNQAAEQMRFEGNLQWQVAQYTLLAYGALVGVWLALAGVGWGTWWVRLIAVVLVIAAWYQAEDTLYNSEARRVLAGDRQKTAIEELHKAACGGLAERACAVPSIYKIYRDNPPVEPLERPHPFWTPWAGRLPPFPYGLAVALSVGASLAIVIIILSRMPLPRPGRQAAILDVDS